ncbi:D-amino acid dehydrogenase [Acidihalobacter prosperus]|uniref:D-amino acid dehydrogenase n=1 Tax=Acidihalobacter prosperus TaxID=160660 RepID=A0A1A6C591_9GAMM|nr:D-amino acid dehydrogenase [Acidihalobacter prosperus]OBS09728.1 D-amino acid dehydrogenase small subunit [Acidihalobacter prosperus]
MKVLIVGAGVIGVTSAWYLQRAGYEVTVVERQAEPALETSFANGGMVSWGYATPWAAPGVPLKALRWLFDADAPLVMRWRRDPAQWRFVAEMLRNCSADRYALNKSRLLRLGRYSHGALVELREALGLRYDEGTGGTLELFRYPAQLEGLDRELALLEDSGIPARLLTPDECLTVEPGLARVRDRLAGALSFPGDEIGDCRKFTEALAGHCRAAGVEFRYGVGVQAAHASGDSIERVDTDHGPLSADAYVIAAGSYAPSLLAPLGIRLPVFPVKGYSLTAPIVTSEAAPVSTMIDEARKVAITRLGDRLRVAGIAELAGYDLSLSEARYGVIERVARDWFPDAADLSRAEYWCGLRPMTPDGPPVVGPTGYGNLFLNNGHGTLGWTLSCGSARLLADIMSGREPDIDSEGLTLARYG